MGKKLSWKEVGEKKSGQWMKRKIAGYFYVERTNLMKDLNQGDKLKCPQEAECRGHGDE